jgi:hypothetical protein
VHPISVDAALELMDECASACVQGVCPACNEMFDLESHTPLVMPCLHSICKLCATEQERESETKTGFGCFDCKIPTQTATRDLQLDYITVGRLKTAAPPTIPSCQICAEETATTHCVDCASINVLCTECFDFAHKKASKRGHRSTPIETHLCGSTSQPSPLKCRYHPTLELELFCRTCEALICVKCGSFAHREHDFIPIDAELAASKDIVVSAAIPTVAEFRTINEALAQCRKMLEELDEHGREGVASIDGLFKVVRQTWVQRKEALTTEFTAAVALKKQIVNECIQQLEGHHDHTQFGLGLVKQALDSATPTQLLGMRRLMVTGLGRLERHGLTMEPSCNSTVRVDPTPAYDTLIETLSKIGTVVRE